MKRLILLLAVLLAVAVVAPVSAHEGEHEDEPDGAALFSEVLPDNEPDPEPLLLFRVEDDEDDGINRLSIVPAQCAALPDFGLHSSVGSDVIEILPDTPEHDLFHEWLRAGVGVAMGDTGGEIEALDGCHFEDHEYICGRRCMVSIVLPPDENNTIPRWKCLWWYYEKCVHKAHCGGG